MKKKYITPDIAVIEIMPQQILAGSPGLDESDMIEKEEVEGKNDWDWLQ